MRILIIKPSSLGDIVHALPTVNLIRKRYPDAKISWLINDNFASVLKNCPIVDEVIPFERQRFGRIAQFPRFLRFTRELREKKFDLVVDLQGLFRSGYISRATRSPRRIGLSDAREGARFFYTEAVNVPRTHAVDRYLLAARHLDCGEGPVEFPVGSSTDDKAAVDKLVPSKERLVAVNPLARWETKIWGDDKFAELLTHLPRERVLLTGSAAEAERIEKISGGRYCNLAGKTDLAQLAELYRRCSVLITNDTGPMHIAAAVGTPIVAIFGPTDPALVGPYGKQHVVVRSQFACPCDGPRCIHSPPKECMTSISVEQVLVAAKPFLA